MTARVWLANTSVAELRPDPASQQTVLEFDASYAASPTRPVLGRHYEDLQLAPPRTFRGAPLPNFFRNLLPEGALRKIIERRIGQTKLPEYTMLLRLGANLPGAVRVLAEQMEFGELEQREWDHRAAADPYRFALTGVQPKLALSEVDDRFTVPVEHVDGHWIAKFGSPALQLLAENEHAMLVWAKLCGLDVPEHRLIEASDIEDLPADFDARQRVLLVRRFDRGGEGGIRIHQEDFAQVFDVAPEHRYAWGQVDMGWSHYGSIGAVVHALAGEEDLLRYMRRLAFMVLSGNADAHLKNWSLIYPDGIHARLSPVYDFVSTVIYDQFHPFSALRWYEPPEPTLEPPKDLVDVTIDDLLLAATPSGCDTNRVMLELEAFIATVRERWPEAAAGAPPFVRKRVAAHLRASQLRV